MKVGLGRLIHHEGDEIIIEKREGVIPEKMTFRDFEGTYYLQYVGQTVVIFQEAGN